MIYKNGEWLDSNSINELQFKDSFTLYEVIRIFKGRPVFIEDNFSRLVSSLSKASININIESIRFNEKIAEFILKNQMDEGNVKYLISFPNPKDLNGNYVEYIFQIPHKYPTAAQYEFGVSVSKLYKERVTPEIKYLNIEFREYAKKLLKERNVYELLLINADNQVTEGSRSNIFFIKDGVLYTSPDSMVLGGTARKRVIDLAGKLGIKVVKQVIYESELAQFESAFITGTSPLVLPISNIDEYRFDVTNPILRLIMECYFKMILV